MTYHRLAVVSPSVNVCQRVVHALANRLHGAAAYSYRSTVAAGMIPIYLSLKNALLNLVAEVQWAANNLGQCYLLSCTL